MAKKPLALLSKEQREHLNHHCQHWFNNELNVDLGQFEVESVIDYFIEQLTPAIHNRAIAEALALVREYHARTEDDLYALEEAERG
ncbi:hypothetical protein BGP77_02870 [Saccharospirillum sp. MSK14-1]|uniref:DUF2164 domain-containing protein n=1 Tax=Saccharospirillum sp. MSK14-1 TaxID=1897632 RepID=UPI000D34F482|nr:DUF2164 family protein [Saccharospirillum sp. MSK14-1]PTY36269.1 hypothetical protein BGP77_02870 [Saccharospirillum sp. MSK14-1]